MEVHLDKKVALILGGSSLIGISLTRLLLERGLRVYTTYSSLDGKERLLSRVRDAITLSLDLGSEEQIRSFFQQTHEPISYFIDLAHTFKEGLFASLKDRDIRDYYRTNVTGRALFLKYMVREMLRQRWGRMIFVSSGAASLVNPGQALYASSKAAAEGLYRGIGVEMRERGISVLILRCGYVDAGRGREFLRSHPSLTPFALTHIEVAEAILFFLSREGQGFCSTEVTLDKGFGSMLKKMATGGK